MSKICADCTYVEADRTYLQASQAGAPEYVCKHPEAKTRNLITGKCYCREERAARKPGCGIQGLLWTSKKPSTAG